MQVQVAILLAGTGLLVLAFAFHDWLRQRWALAEREARWYADMTYRNGAVVVLVERRAQVGNRVRVLGKPDDIAVVPMALPGWRQRVISALIQAHDEAGGRNGE